MDNWDEIRTAFQVAKLGTVSGAADALGVHHATVIRHVDALEARLGVRLFQRHARGYTPTEAGSDLLKVASTTDEQFAQLANRIRGRGEAVTGELVITSLPGMSKLLTPVMIDFQRDHPEVTIRYLTDARVFRLEYGEAHVAIRAGSTPDEPDNVVQPFFAQQVGLYAHADYLERFGRPADADLLTQLRFVADDDVGSRAPFYKWLNANVARDQVVFRSSDPDAQTEAILQGAAAGFLPEWLARDNPAMVELMAPRPEWESPSWLVTHVDLHRTPKVQAFLSHLKAAAQSWPCAKPAA